jgi:hypothetical protein
MTLLSRAATNYVTVVNLPAISWDDAYEILMNNRRRNAHCIGGRVKEHPNSRTWDVELAFVHRELDWLKEAM